MGIPNERKKLFLATLILAAFAILMFSVFKFAPDQAIKWTLFTLPGVASFAMLWVTTKDIVVRKTTTS